MLLRSPRCRAVGRDASGFAVAAMAFAAATAALGAKAAEPGIRVSGPWFQVIMPSRPAAGYFALTNDSAEARTLVGAASPGCGMLLPHRSVSHGGVEQMELVQSIPVPTHSGIAFVPGGYHLMCMSPAASLTPGASVPVTLRFADGGSITVDFPVRNATGNSVV
jgi:copper(I)-binding protein